jgi:hypothetical protein
MNTLEIKKMSKSERLQAMEALWDSLIGDEAEIESPEWHRDILGARCRTLNDSEKQIGRLPVIFHRSQSSPE